MVPVFPGLSRRPLLHPYFFQSKGCAERHPPGATRQLYTELFGHRLREGDGPPVSLLSAFHLRAALILNIGDESLSIRF